MNQDNEKEDFCCKDEPCSTVESCDCQGVCTCQKEIQAVDDLDYNQCCSQVNNDSDENKDLNK